MEKKGSRYFEMYVQLITNSCHIGLKTTLDYFFMNYQ